MESFWEKKFSRSLNNPVELADEVIEVDVEVEEIGIDYELEDTIAPLPLETTSFDIFSNDSYDIYTL